ncbi:MAG: protease complex subunit PrcB family protein [Actinobacteria bacterium]|nr:protease complex subunit PrcB family protein [Actinomycetota bacterium]MBL7123485.1 protease complex subunit PrcB family protein [Actinomycetota bacterium]
MIKRIKISLTLLILSIFLLLFLFACGKENGGKIVEFDTISKGFYSLQVEKEYFVIKDTENFNQLLAIIADSNSDITNKYVDFSKEIVVGVFLGEKPTGGYNIEITEVLEQNDYIEVLIKIDEPDPDEMVTQAITSPYHIIKLKISDMEFLFNISEQG